MKNVEQKVLLQTVAQASALGTTVALKNFGDEVAPLKAGPSGLKIKNNNDTNPPEAKPNNSVKVRKKNNQLELVIGEGGLAFDFTIEREEDNVIILFNLSPKEVANAG